MPPTIIDARDTGVITTAPGPVRRAGHWLADGWPPAVELWRRDVCHRFGSLDEPLLAFPLAAWTAASAPLILIGALVLWTAAKPIRIPVCGAAVAAAFILLGATVNKENARSPGEIAHIDTNTNDHLTIYWGRILRRMTVFSLGIGVFALVVQGVIAAGGGPAVQWQWVAAAIAATAIVRLADDMVFVAGVYRMLRKARRELAGGDGR